MNNKIFYAVFSLFFLAVFTLSHVTIFFDNGVHVLDLEVDKKLKLTGIICDDPVSRDKTQTICFKPENARDKILLSAPKYPLYKYGDEIEIHGKLEMPENFETYPGGPEFDYVSYLLKDGIRYLMKLPAVVKVGEGKGNSIIKILFDIKHSFVHKIELLFPEPEASILGGILIGDKHSIPKDVTEDFKNAGLVHILVLSGYNVTLVAQSFMGLFSFLPRFLSRFLGAGSIILFALMTGASGTTVRASLMALIVIGAQGLGRRYDVIRALVLAAFLMVIYNPYILAFDISFQLSFLATVALIYVSPLVVAQLSFITEKWKLREIIATTIATQVFVAPFLVYTMGQISIISFISNIFVLPVIPCVMFLGFISVGLSYIFMYVALPFAWITSMLLSYVVKAVSFFGNVPNASIQMRASAFALALIYLSYILLLIYLHRSQNSSRESPN